MKKGRTHVAIHHYILVLLLTLLLIISVSLAWYSANDKVHASGINGAVEGSKGLIVDEAIIFRADHGSYENNDLNSPYPVGYDGGSHVNEISDLLPGESVFISISITTTKQKDRNIVMNIRSIEGDALTSLEGEPYMKPDDVLYSMCDVYSIKLNSIWLTLEEGISKLSSTDQDGHLNENPYNPIYFTGGVNQGSDKVFIDSLNFFTYLNWDSIGMITFTFEMKFDFDLITDETIGPSSTSNKYLNFDSIFVVG